MEPVGRLEEDAAVGAIVASPSSRCSSTDASLSSGMRALQHLAELLRVADEHEVARRGAHRERVGERDLAGLVDEEVVELPVVLVVGEEPRGAAEQLAVVAVVVVEHVLDPVALVLRLLAVARLLEAAERDAELGRAFHDLLEQLVDRAVARRGDTHALAGVDESRDQAARGPRLARARRALDHEVPSVEREQELRELLQIVRLHVAVERLAAEHRLDRGIAAVAARAASSAMRSSAASCAFVLYGPPGRSASGSGTSAKLLPRFSSRMRSSRS